MVRHNVTTLLATCALLLLTSVAAQVPIDDIGACGDNSTLISAVQGAGAEVGITDEVVVEGVVTHSRYGGFFLQEEPADSDDDEATSEAIWVYAGTVVPDADKVVGNVFRVRGVPSDENGLSQIAWAEMVDCGLYSGEPIAPIVVTLPFTDLEPFEGMLATVTDGVIVSLDTFLRFGEIDLADSLRFTPSDVAIPLSAEFEAEALKNAAPVLKIDDDSPNNPTSIDYYPTLSYDDAPRLGDRVSASGPISFAYDNWRMFADASSFSIVGGRPVEDHVRSDASIATYNVLNYFNGQYDETSNTVTFNYPENRGADNADEFALQQARIIAALAALDADVVTLSEIENDGFGERSALKHLTDALNEVVGNGVYDFVSPVDVDAVGQNKDVTGTDVITNAIIYKAATVAPIGGLVGVQLPTQHNGTEGVLKAGMRNALVQSFRHLVAGDTFAVSANHFKSKGSGCFEDDDGPSAQDAAQGSCNALRVSAVVALANALEAMDLPDKVFVVGDLNSYTFEDPIAVLTSFEASDRSYAIRTAVNTELDSGASVEITAGFGYTDITEREDPEGFSYNFGGRVGALTHIVGTDAAADAVVDLERWNVNSPELEALEYKDALQTTSFDFAGEGPYRASDHDPVLVSIDLLDLECGNTAQATLISSIQGAGSEVTTTDFVIVEGVVTHSRFGGFYLQEEPADSDNDAATSEAIWVYAPDVPAVTVGTIVRVSGHPQEFFELSQLSLTAMIECDAGDNIGLITPVAISLPIGDLEPFEGMLATVSDGLIVSLDDFTQFGEIDLADSLRWTPSDVAIPFSAAYDAEVLKNAAPVLKIDDDGPRNPATISYYPEALNYENAPRIGDLVNAFGPISYAFGNWRVLADDFSLTSMRPDEDIERSDVSIASYNVLNYFNGEYDDASGNVTFDFSANRGARSAEAFELQQARILATLVKLNADVITLSEMENDGFGERSAIKQLTDELNSALRAMSPGLADDVYTFVAPGGLDEDGKNTGVTGTDAITNAIIYKAAVVSPAGGLRSIRLPTQRYDNGGFKAGMRPALVQTFRYLESGDFFAVSANHLKSKGSTCFEDEDNETPQGEVQGSCNALRVSAAVALSEGLQRMQPTLPAKVIIVGDLNCYTNEDPMAVLTSLSPSDERNYTVMTATSTELDGGAAVAVTDGFGFIDLTEAEDPDGFSYFYYGTDQVGSLSHVVGTQAAANVVRDLERWNINAQELYQLTYFQALDNFNGDGDIDFTGVGPYRSSDHDPLLVSLDMADFGVCGDASSVTLISAIQGAGTEVTTTDFVIVEALVTHIHQNGFFLQEEPRDSDSDDATSEAIWVFGELLAGVAVGDHVRVSGYPAEYFGVSQIVLGKMVNCGGGLSDYLDIVPVRVDLPVSDLERYEGMLGTVTEGVIVSLESFTQYGEITLSNEIRWAPSDVAVPLSPEYEAEVRKNDVMVLNIDDDASGEYPSTISYLPGLSYSNAPRLGYKVSAKGPIHYSFSTWEIIPTADDFTMTGSRPVEDHVRADVSVASYNVLNYFNGQIDETTGQVVIDFPGNRGARSAEQFALQKARIVATLIQLDAGVITLSEMENDGFGEQSALKDLTDALNDALGDVVYAFVAPVDVDEDGKNEDVTGTDAITNAIIYKTAVVEPMGALVGIPLPFQRDGGSIIGMRNALTQTFRYLESGDTFAVSANHFKSKGSECLEDASPSEQDEIQGSCNALRVSAAVALVDALESMNLPEKLLIVGDLNCYTNEDPMAVLTSFSNRPYDIMTAATETDGAPTTVDEGFGLVDLTETFDPEGFSYFFHSTERVGSLSHIVGTEAAADAVVGLERWNINAQELYQMTYFQALQFYGSDKEIDFTGVGPYRSSDHDPLLVSLDMADMGECGEPATKISAVQGEGDEVAITDIVVVEGVVTQRRDLARGFFLQEEAGDSDGNIFTSEAIWVFDDHLPADVQVGDVVRVRGQPGEFNGMSQLTEIATKVCGTQGSIDVVEITLPIVNDLEAVECMVATVTDGVIVSLDEFTQFGEIQLDNELRWVPSDVAIPLSARYYTVERRSGDPTLHIDDETNGQYPSTISYYRTEEYDGLRYDNAPRVGDLVTATGPIAFSYTDWRLLPTKETFSLTSMRPTENITRSDLSIASYNVLNYFNGQFDADTNEVTIDFPGNRGARSAEQFALQEARIVAALVELDADVITLSEMENDGFGTHSALKQLTDALNHRLHEINVDLVEEVYSFVAPADVDENGENRDVTGTDAITNAIIYKSTVVKPLGGLVGIPLPRQHDGVGGFLAGMRNALVQRFAHSATGDSFAVSANHFKSKGGACYEDMNHPSDQDAVQDSCNALRVSASVTLGEELAKMDLPEKVIILGDLNCYTNEDPMAVLTTFERGDREYEITTAMNTERDEGRAVVVTEGFGFVDLTETFDSEGFSYFFHEINEVGSLSHIVGTQAAANAVVDLERWNINAQELYQLTYFQALQYYNSGDEIDFTGVGPYRSSDHDPLLISLRMGGSVDQGSSIEDGAGDSSAGIIAGVVIGLIVILGVAAFMFFRSKHARRLPPAMQTESTANPHARLDEDDGGAVELS